MPRTGLQPFVMLIALIAAVWSFAPMTGVSQGTDIYPSVGVQPVQMVTVPEPLSDWHEAQGLSHAMTHASCYACVVGPSGPKGRDIRQGRSLVSPAISTFLLGRQVAPQMRPPDRNVLL